jgi:hypothetical protein
VKPYKVDQGKWNNFSKNIQLQHIATELSRATQASLRHEKEWKDGAYERAISMIDASLEDPQWQDRGLLYSMRDTVSALYIGKLDPAISNFVSTQIFEKSER